MLDAEGWDWSLFERIGLEKHKARDEVWLTEKECGFGNDECDYATIMEKQCCYSENWLRWTMPALRGKATWATGSEAEILFGMI